jgi:hypothetical protein
MAEIDFQPIEFQEENKGIDFQPLEFQEASQGNPIVEYIGATVKNIPSDAWRLTKDIASMVIHPIDTLRGARDIVRGAGQTLSRDLFGGKSDYSPEEQAFLSIMNPVSESIMEPGGIPGRVKEFVKERPVMSLFNASLGVGGVGKVAEAAGMARTAATLGKIAEVTNPVLQAGRLTVGTVKTVVPAIGKIVKESLGAYTGRGPGFVEEMIKGADVAEKAMRGELTGEEVVSHAQTALQKLRDMRGEEYIAKLETVRANPEVLQSVASDLNKTVRKLAAPDKFDLALDLDEAGKLQVDFSKSTIVEHQNVVRRALEDINGWTDNSAAGLDTLKKRLSTYIDQSGRDTPAKALITQLEKNLSGGLKKAVPEYEAMTAGYREASGLIKDIESNLMLRKEGLTGRITADQTLRRLSSSLRENFEMRKDLLRALGTESGMNVPAEVAGYLAQQWLPAGMIGKGLATANAYFGLVNPKMWPVLAASSPRVVGEFLNAYGKAANAVKKGAGRVVDFSERQKTRALGSGDNPLYRPEVMAGEGKIPPRPPRGFQDAYYGNELEGQTQRQIPWQDFTMSEPERSLVIPKGQYYYDVTRGPAERTMAGNIASQQAYEGATRRIVGGRPYAGEPGIIDITPESVVTSKIPPEVTQMSAANIATQIKDMVQVFPEQANRLIRLAEKDTALWDAQDKLFYRDMLALYRGQEVPNRGMVIPDRESLGPRPNLSGPLQAPEQAAAMGIVPERPPVAEIPPRPGTEILSEVKVSPVATPATETTSSARAPEINAIRVQKTEGTRSFADISQKNPDEMVTVYRAIPEGVDGNLNAGDFVTTDRQLASFYAKDIIGQRGDATSVKIVPTQVRADEIKLHPSHQATGVTNEFIYRPKQSPSPLPTAGKQPWEMTKAEYMDSKIADMESKIRVGVKPVDALPPITTNENTHYAQVKQALAEGKPVPPSVLKDYPELKPSPLPEAGAKAETLAERSARFTKETEAKFAEEAASTETITEREARRKAEASAPEMTESEYVKSRLSELKKSVNIRPGQERNLYLQEWADRYKKEYRRKTAEMPGVEPYKRTLRESRNALKKQ